MSCFRRFAVLGAAIIPLSLSVFCGKGENPAGSQENYGMIEIMARMVNLPSAKGAAPGETAGANRTAATVADSLAVEIRSDGMETVTIKHKLDFTRPSVIDTVKKVPIGKNRRIRIWAESKGGKVTHIDSLENRAAVNIDAAVVTQIYATLIQAMGSIYLQLLEPPARTRIYAAFRDTAGTVVAENSANRAPRTFISLDNIQHGTKGVLSVSVVDTASGDTTYVAKRELTFNARGDNTIELQFIENVGMIGVSVSIYEPGVTVGSYDFSGKAESLVSETGELIITEIMWGASADNWIELYNTTKEELSFDELVTDVDGTVSRFMDVKIAAGGYFTIGRKDTQYADAYGSLPITTTGNFITVKRKDGTVIDRVVCAGSNTALGWPSVSGKRSIELDRSKYSAAGNNYGKNWKVTTATEPLPGTTDQYGTPGR